MATFTVRLMDYFDETTHGKGWKIQADSPQGAARAFVVKELHNHETTTYWKVMVSQKGAADKVFCIEIRWTPSAVITDQIPWPRPEDTMEGLPPCSKDCGSTGTPFERGCDDCDMREDGDA